jgi:uncharacterized protein (DUF2132 family)
MNTEQPDNPLHGITLECILENLVEHYGWSGLALKIAINCFRKDPSIKSSLKFLRRTPWARQKVEALYISTFQKKSPWANSTYGAKK